MKIEAGKSYRTRNGRKAVVFGIAPDGFYNVAGYVEGGYGVLVWSEDGTCSTCETLKLVSEWEEPKPENWGLYGPNIVIPLPGGIISQTVSVADLLNFLQAKHDTLAARIAKLEEQ